MTERDKGSTGAVRVIRKPDRTQRWMNAVMSHNPCTFHTCAQLMKSPFACDATVDPGAHAVPQVVDSEESLRVQDVSKDPANLYRGQSGAQDDDQNRTNLLWECDQA